MGHVSGEKPEATGLIRGLGHVLSFSMFFCYGSPSSKREGWPAQQQAGFRSLQDYKQRNMQLAVCLL